MNLGAPISFQIRPEFSEGTSPVGYAHFLRLFDRAERGADWRVEEDRVVPETVLTRRHVGDFALHRPFGVVLGRRTERAFWVQQDEGAYEPRRPRTRRQSQLAVQVGELLGVGRARISGAGEGSTALESIDRQS